MWVLALRATCALHPPPPPSFDLAGACAGVKTRETWKDDTDTHHWTYKIKVQPWTTFGRITVTLHGWSMKVENTFYAYVDSPAKEFEVVLHPRPGPDNIFEIQGTGEAYADPDVRCAGLQMPNASMSDCLLGPHFVIDSDWASIESGRFRAHVHMNLWVLQTIITIDFGKSALEIGHDLNGARIIEGGDGSSPKAVVSLLPLKNCLGMYKDASCDRSFSFTAVLLPSTFTLPAISCMLTRDLPMPPPPRPPTPPPSPPPGFAVDPNLCYLGGQAHFVVAPHKDSKGHAGMQVWILNVHLDKWLAGLRVVLDFPGGTTADHPLHVHSVRPAEVARLLSVTRHSAIIELQVTAARDFQFEALGDVSDVRVVCDVGDARPPPPPPPEPPVPPPAPVKSPRLTLEDFYAEDEGDLGANGALDIEAVRRSKGHANVAVLGRDEAVISSKIDSKAQPPPPPPFHTESGDMGFKMSLLILLVIGLNILLYQKDPACYMRMVAKLVRWTRKKANKSPQGRKLIQIAGSTTTGRSLLQCEMRHLGILGTAASGDDQHKLLPPAPPEEHTLLPAASPNARTPPKARRDVTGVDEDGLDNGDDETLALEHLDDGNSDERDDASSRGGRDCRDVRDSRSCRGNRDGSTKLVIKLRGSSRNTAIKLEDVRDIQGLQRQVARICAELNIDTKGGLRMQYANSRGEVNTVSKSTPMSSIRKAKELQLLPKAQGSDSSRRTPGNCRAVPDD